MCLLFVLVCVWLARFVVICGCWLFGGCFVVIYCCGVVLVVDWLAAFRLSAV